MSSPCLKYMLFALAFTVLNSCEREERRFQPPPETAAASPALRLSEIQPGQIAPGLSPENPYEENAYAVSQGKRYFRMYNCSGCHGQGGGGSGPALMDDKWIYGSEPAQIVATIKQGRPNGMPSFGGHIPDDQVWQLAAYIRSMSGQLKTDVAPSRSDSLQTTKPEQRRSTEEPAQSNLPASSSQ